MAYEWKKYPSFSWSSSRNDTFQECPRKYYYQYYGSHNGWEDDAPQEARTAYLLKSLNNIHGVLGQAVHEFAALAIYKKHHHDYLCSLQDALTYVRGKLNKSYSDSQDKEKWRRYPKGFIMLQDFYYGTPPTEKVIEIIRQKVKTCCENIFSSRSYREAIVSPSVEIRDIENFIPFELNGIQIYAVPDLIYRYGDDTWVITDWKTGDIEEIHKEQIKVYALYIQARHSSKPSKLIGRLEYLNKGENVEIEISLVDLKKTSQYIKDSVACMRRYLEDPIKNIPRDKNEFPMKEDSGFCCKCGFYELCEEEIKSRTSGPF